MVSNDINIKSYGEGMAIREDSSGKGRYDLISPFALDRIAKRMEFGANKYAEHNWENGMPFSRYIDSALRHITQYVKGDNSEDHLAAACFNLMAIMHHEELNQTDLNDLPDYGCRQDIPDDVKDTEISGHSDINVHNAICTLNSMLNTINFFNAKFTVKVFMTTNMDTNIKVDISDNVEINRYYQYIVAGCKKIDEILVDIYDNNPKLKSDPEYGTLVDLVEKAKREVSEIRGNSEFIKSNWGNVD